MNKDLTPIQRKVRSFVMRTGRMTEGQKLALKTGWPALGLTVEHGPYDLKQVFGRDAPVVFEIGFGNGDSLLEMAKAAPGKNYIGVEVHTPGVGKLLHHIQDENLLNLRVCREDAVEFLTHCVPDHSLDTVQLFFPDPWHKKRHHKRRIVQPDFAALLGRKLKPGGVFHAATDWQHYAEHIVEVMEAAPGWENTEGKGMFLPTRPAHRPETKYERRGIRLGHEVWDIQFRAI